jgi:hypothetical protein
MYFEVFGSFSRYLNITPSGSQITDLEGYRKVSLFFVLIHALAFQFVGLEGLMLMFNPVANGN